MEGRREERERGRDGGGERDLVDEAKEPVLLLPVLLNQHNLFKLPFQTLFVFSIKSDLLKRLRLIDLYVCRHFVVVLV